MRVYVCVCVRRGWTKLTKRPGTRHRLIGPRCNLRVERAGSPRALAEEQAEVQYVELTIAHRLRRRIEPGLGAWDNKRNETKWIEMKQNGSWTNGRFP